MTGKHSYTHGLKIAQHLALTTIVLLGMIGRPVAQTITKATDKASFSWDTTIVDLGQIPQGTPVEAIFKFTNDSKIPLVITHVSRSCGCTATDYPDAPIMPGKTSTIKATYDAKALGAFDKTVTVYSNASQPVILRIKGKVVQE